jgi:ABC-2 type transport system ATP-binding protein
MDNSGGEQRRTSLAVAMLHQPELLILDEPTVGVDPLIRERSGFLLEAAKLVFIRKFILDEALFYFSAFGFICEISSKSEERL